MKQLLLFILIALLFGACSDKKADPQKLAKEQAERDSLALKVAVMPTMDCLPLFYAQRCGIFHQLNLDVRLLKYDAQMDVDTAIVNGHADVAYTDLIRAALLQSRGTGLYAISPVESNIYKLTSKERKKQRIDALPGSLAEALDSMDKSLVAKAALGEHIFKEFMTAKKKEWDSFRTFVSQWELEKYLERY